MIEIKAAPPGVREYIIATRGVKAERLVYSTDLMMRYFVDLAESNDPLGPTAPKVSMVFVNSPRGDIEHLHMPERSIVLVDQSYFELLGLVTESALRTISEGSLREPYASIPSALFAARGLALGDIDGAVMDASICRSLRNGDPRPYPAELEKRDAWVQVQACSAIGHEYAHSRIPGSAGTDSGVVFASAILSSFEDRIRPAIDFYDKKSGGVADSEDWNDLWDILPGQEDALRPVARARTISWNAKLNWINQTQDAFGQEVVCDYYGILTVARNNPGRLIPLDELILASYVGLIARVGLQIVENRILVHTDRRPNDIIDTYKRAAELRTRIEMLNLIARQVYRYALIQDLGGPAVAERTDAVIKERSTLFQEKLSRLQRDWVFPMIQACLSGPRFPAMPDDAQTEFPKIRPWDLESARNFVSESIGVRPTF